MRIDFDAMCHIGKVRVNNEDMILIDHDYVRNSQLQKSFKLKTRNRFCALVADGMGGHAGGEYASELAAHLFDTFLTDLPPELETEELKLEIDKWVIDTHLAINNGGNNSSHKGMGTTLTGCFFYNHKMYWLNIGDSRIYILRDGLLRQLTTDHSLRNLMQDDNIPTNVIYNCFGGGGDDVFADFDELPIYENDRFLICSDGLSDMINDDLLQQLLNADAPARDYVALANEAGGQDNISVVTMKFVRG